MLRKKLSPSAVDIAGIATGSPLHLEELAERRRPAAVLQVTPEAEREQQRPEPAAPSRPRARAAPALHGVHEADQARQRHAATAAARQGPGRLRSTDSKISVKISSRVERCYKNLQCMHCSTKFTSVSKSVEGREEEGREEVKVVLKEDEPGRSTPLSTPAWTFRAPSPRGQPSSCHVSQLGTNSVTNLRPK